jgi:oligopeptide transport system substrate-binding protein
LQIALLEPWAAFPHLLALWPAVPLRQDVLERHGERWTHPGYYLGNGPFRMTDWTYQDQITLASNENYVGDNPRLQKITMTMTGDPSAELTAYLRGEQHIVSLPPGDAVRVLAVPSFRPELLRYGDLATLGLRLNPAKPPFDNPRVRQALALALDREALVRQVWDGLGRPAYGWLPPGMPEYDPELGGRHRQDVAAARRILAEVGLGNGESSQPLVYSYANTGSGPGHRLAAALKGQLGQHLSLGVEPTAMSPRSFRDALARDDYQMTWFGWAADFPDPDPRSWVRGLFPTDGASDALFADPALEDLARQARSEPDAARRLELWRAVQRLLADEATLLFLYHRENVALVKLTVKGLKPTPLDGRFPGRHFYRDVYFAE